MKIVTPSKRQPEYQFDLSGGRLCLDFANTVSHRHDPERLAEHLKDFADLVSFAEQTKILSPREARAQRLRAGNQAGEARHSCAKAMRLRELLFRIFSAIAARRTAAPDDLEFLNDYARKALAHREVVKSDGAYQWQWNSAGREALDRVLWPIVQSAVELLTSDDLAALRLCDASDCDWLFLDNSRNRSRRWCDMKSCGNRQKARRHYQRIRA